MLVHAIKKKTDKIPEESLKLCLKRKAQVEKYSQMEKLVGGHKTTRRGDLGRPQ